MIRPVSASLLVLSALTATACSLNGPTAPCTAADDCLLPLVCCRDSLALTIESLEGPHCVPRATCVAGGGSYLPNLPAGAPCRRSAADEQCADGLVCCDRNLTCTTEAACTAAPLPPETPGSEAACGADSECSAGICCGIDWERRDGRCADVRSCAAGRGISVPAADASVSDAGGADAGGPDLVGAICQAAYCTDRGGRPPNAAELAACREAFANGTDALGRSGLAVTPACLAAVEASRGLCAPLLRWRDVARPNGVNYQQPVLPGPCYAPAPTAPAVAAAACARLMSCGLVTDAADCERQVASLDHDALSRVADSTGCAFGNARFGTLGPSLFGRCASAGDCPAGLSCVPELARGGLCVPTGGCDASACGLLGGVCFQGYCTLACNADVTSGNQRETVRMQCNGRVEPMGRPGELACFRTAEGGRCVSAPELDACPVADATMAAGRSWLGFLSCRANAPGARGRFEVCDPGLDECATGRCDPTLRRCVQPCMMAPVDVSGPTCPMGELCVSPASTPGWGTVGVCAPDCSRDANLCPAGTSCQTAWPNRACL